jgi:transposase
VISELGCLAGSALGALRRAAPVKDCAPARSSVESIQWGDAPASASTGLMRRRGRSSEMKGGTMGLNAEWFVGIDWATDAHDVCIVDPSGRIVARAEVPHTAVGLQAFVDSLLRRAQGDPTRLALGIEVPRGGLVELCVERGVPVYAINPKQVDRFRDRFTMAGAKDDPRDAHVISDALRTDPHAFRQVRLDHPLVIQLREWARLDDDLRDELSRLTSQLRDLVYRSTPGVLALCPAADEPWFWALLAIAPTPTTQGRLSLRRLTHLLRAHRIRRLVPTALHQVLQQPPMYTAPGVIEAVAAHVAVLLPRLALVARQRRDAARELTRLLDALETARPAEDQREHSDVAIVRSMPGIGTRVAARMLSEASQPLVDRAYHVVRCWMGTAPVTKQSGRRRRSAVTMRYACNRYLREAAYHWGRTAVQQDPPTRTYYQSLRHRGHSHARALRSVVDRCLRILFALLNRGQLFDPSHRRQPLANGA